MSSQATGTDSAVVKDLSPREQFPEIYGELKRLANSYLRSERTDHTLQPTALVNEAYLRLHQSGGDDYKDRKHFFATAARAMRQVLVDHARGRSAQKRQPVTLGGSLIGSEPRPVDFLDLDRAMRDLAEADPQRGSILELHFFGGLTVPETAEVLGVAERTVFRKLRSSKAWLKNALSNTSDITASG